MHLIPFQFREHVNSALKDKLTSHLLSHPSVPHLYWETGQVNGKATVPDPTVDLKPNIDLMNENRLTDNLNIITTHLSTKSLNISGIGMLFWIHSYDKQYFFLVMLVLYSEFCCPEVSCGAILEKKKSWYLEGSSPKPEKNLKEWLWMSAYHF